MKKITELELKLEDRVIVKNVDCAYISFMPFLDVCDLHL
jgi:hypothetical protein